MRIDVHAHCYTPDFVEAMARLGCSWQPSQQVMRIAGVGQRRLDELAAVGIDVQVLSLGAQQPYIADVKASVEAARLANDFYHEVVAQSGGRYAAFGCVPLPHIGEAIAEAARCLDELGFLGINLGCTVAGRTLQAPELEPFWAELDRRHTVVFLHPLGNAHVVSEPYDLSWTVGGPLEDTVAALGLVRARLPERFPQVKIIVPHLGGTIPFLWERFEGALRRQQSAGEATELASIADGLRRLYYDTVNLAPASLRCACDTIGADRLMLGTDYPYHALQHCVGYVQQAGLEPEQAEAILDRNAASLLGVPSPSERGVV